MCTMTWNIEQGSYHVFFNRDEFKTRSKAIPPKQYSVDGMQVIMPLDPDGGGTWFAVNHFGCTFALLNYYQGNLPKGDLVSRGSIVKHCVGFSAFCEVYRYLQSANLHHFAPFSFVCFMPEGQKGWSVRLFQWDGVALSIYTPRPPISSCAFDIEQVIEARKLAFEQMIRALPEGVNTSLDFAQLHQSHHAHAPTLSYCLHRHDSETVSFTQLTVDHLAIHLSYCDGPPCQTTMSERVSMMRSMPPEHHLDRAV
ncbi:NRDE family protein [Echinimonas agarilytica]|uniref:NRDE family protein n=1 Tax=Echinimonas agarilytica TaxID=1215918 RepID=A0AA41W654_9GAMM|nr:NRDE family protein [Echinimonas agarilytica]MCM2679412.1 NRDE family protein [Echinimonas agarilytica]